MRIVVDNFQEVQMTGRVLCSIMASIVLLTGSPAWGQSKGEPIKVGIVHPSHRKRSELRKN